MWMIIYLHRGFAARGVEDCEPFVLGELPVSVLVSLVKHLTDLERRFPHQINKPFSKISGPK